jgi:hypothetical protein
MQSCRMKERDRSKAGLDGGAFQAIEGVREIADHLRASDQRISDLEAGRPPRAYVVHPGVAPLGGGLNAPRRLVSALRLRHQP